MSPGNATSKQNALNQVGQSIKCLEFDVAPLILSQGIHKNSMGMRLQ